ncbi:MAG: hypothetical protein ACM3L6_00065 [Deltaproteobacteria bacterium]
MGLTDKQKTLGLYALHFLPAVPFIAVGFLVSWQQGQMVRRAYGPPSWEAVKDLILVFKFFVVIPLLVLVAAYFLCRRLKRRGERALLVYGAWIVLATSFSFLGAISCEGVTTGLAGGAIRPLELFKDLLPSTLYFLAWFQAFIVPWVLLFLYAMKRFPWFFKPPSVEARILTSVPYDRPGVTVPGALPRPWKKRKTR